MEGRGVIRIDLVPQARRHAQARRQLVLRWTAALSIYGAVLAGAWVITGMPTAARQADLAAKLAKLEGVINDGEREEADIRARITRTTRALDTAAAVSDHPDWSILLRALAGEREDEIVLQSVKLSERVEALTPPPAKPGAPAGAPPASGGARGPARPPSPPPPKTTYTVAVEGLALSQSAVVRFVRRIEALGAMDTVRIKQTRASTFGSVPAVGFELECTTTEQRPRGDRR
jgi:Tfp pilus assembly protein PilN